MFVNYLAGIVYKHLRERLRTIPHHASAAGSGGGLPVTTTAKVSVGKGCSCSQPGTWRAPGRGYALGTYMAADWVGLQPGLRRGAAKSTWGCSLGGYTGLQPGLDCLYLQAVGAHRWRLR